MQKLLHKAKRDANILGSETRKYEDKTAEKIEAYKSVAAVFNSVTSKHEAIDNVAKTYNSENKR